MNFFFQIQSLQLLIFYMDYQELAANLDYILLCFLCSVIKIDHFLHRFIMLLHLVSSFLHIKSLHVPHASVSIESFDCILLSSLALNAILLTFSVNTLCFSLLNLCCVFNINLLFFYKFFMTFFKIIYVSFIFLEMVYFILKLSCF